MADDIAIKVDNVSKTFKLPHEKQSSLKGVLISRVRGGNRSYESQEVLRNVSFEIKKGEFFAIVGRNGSGKSTLLKMLAGIYNPTKGSIQVEGKLTPFIELGVGFNPELTGRENVFLNGALLGFSRKEMEGMYDNIVSFAELGRFMDQKLKNYSSGMQVRLAFSIAIRANSDILLLDEVLAVGDAAFQQKCYNYFEELKARNQTVVFVSHDMGAVTRFCTRAIYIKNGDMILDGTPNDVADLYREENIATEQPKPTESNLDAAKKPSGFSVSTKLAKQTDSSVVIEVGYKSRQDETFVGISLIRDGKTFAEIVTNPEYALVGSGNLHYTVDTSLYNSGVYEVTAALFRRKNRELLAFTKRGSEFVIKGSDPMRGAAVKLADTWKYDKANTIKP